MGNWYPTIKIIPGLGLLILSAAKIKFSLSSMILDMVDQQDNFSGRAIAIRQQEFKNKIT